MRVLQLKEDSVASAEGVVSIMADKSLVGQGCDSIDILGKPSTPALIIFGVLRHV